MKIAIGADHRGFAYKGFIKKYILSVDWVDVGAYSADRTDYPLYANKVVELMRAKTVAYGVLLCGSGGGMAIATNRYEKIYAVVAWNEEVAKRCKAEDNANILVLPSDFISCDDAVRLINIWIAQEFKGGRYAERIAMIDKKK